MAWQRLVRSMEAGTRRAELAVRRRNRTTENARRHYDRESSRFERQKARLEAAEQAANDAQRFKQYLKSIVEFHKDWIHEWDWHEISHSSQPPPPDLTNAAENSARLQLAEYKPGLLTQIFGNTAKRISELTQAIETAQAADARENAEMLNRYKEVVTTWDIERRLAKLVLAKDPDGYREVLKYVDALGEFGDFGSFASVTSAESDFIVIRYEIADRETIPTEELELSPSGKLLSQTMSGERYWAIYLEHACSAALRIARDVFNVTPVKRVIVNVARTNMNSITGYRVRETILAVRFLRNILNQLDLQAIHPHDAIYVFQPRMKFHRAVGFEPVEPLTDG